jgi:hypothetical protein
MACVIFVVLQSRRIGQGEVIAGDFAGGVEHAIENLGQRVKPEERERGLRDPGALAGVSLKVCQLVPNHMALFFKRPVLERKGEGQGVVSQPPGHGHGVFIKEDDNEQRGALKKRIAEPGKEIGM